MKRMVMFLFFVIVVLFVSIFVKFHTYYTPAEKQVGLTITKHFDDTIRIVYIGDSWADGHKSVDCVIGPLVCKAIGRPVVVKIAGISGLTSKNIYYGFFKNDSFRDAIEWGPDFCFVVAGINDSDRKMGKGYYKKNMRLIIELLLENNIVPIVLEIPTYDIRYSYERRDKQTKMLYLLSMLVTWSRMDCIDDYRSAYKELINVNKWNKQVITICHDEWNPKGFMDSRELYDEGRMHLNERGYHVLDTCISSQIVHWITYETEK